MITLKNNQLNKYIRADPGMIIAAPAGLNVGNPDFQVGGNEVTSISFGVILCRFAKIMTKHKTLTIRS
jgi:hypothetical protein